MTISNVNKQTKNIEKNPMISKCNKIIVIANILNYKFVSIYYSYMLILKRQKPRDYL